ncbi:MAG: 3-dehydroquinate synthase [Myxococcota bacterium]
MTTIQVLLGDRSYPIFVLPGSLRELGPTIAQQLGASRVVVVTTPKVAELHYAELEQGLASARVRVDRIEVPDGERAKTLRTASKVYDELIELGTDRSSVLIGLGGGALCDLTGFVASTYLRGVSLVQVPTTLLAQVDASVGGKTGVNHPRGKNLIGTFYQPQLVWIDPTVLQTLPPRERRSGMAEVVKVAALWDAEFFAWLEKEMEPLMALEPQPLAHAISRACRIKAEIVGLDEREAGLRALLNFGHTLGHALENVAEYRRYRHGEAVALGMIFAVGLSESRGLCPAGCQARMRDLLGRIGLPSDPPRIEGNRETYLRALSVDKKVRGEKLGFVVLRDIGRAEVLRLTPEEILEVEG